jgi:hypothetical protein
VLQRMAFINSSLHFIESMTQVSLASLAGCEPTESRLVKAIFSLFSFQRASVGCALPFGGFFPIFSLVESSWCLLRPNGLYVGTPFLSNFFFIFLRRLFICLGKLRQMAPPQARRYHQLGESSWYSAIGSRFFHYIRQ